MVHKRVRGWTSRRSLPVQNVFDHPPSQPPPPPPHHTYTHTSEYIFIKQPFDKGPGKTIKINFLARKVAAIVKYMTGLSTLGAPELVSGYWHKMVLCSHLEYPADMYLCAYLKLELTSEYKALVRIDPELTKTVCARDPRRCPFYYPWTRSRP